MADYFTRHRAALNLLKQTMSILSDFAPRHEVYSIDECFRGFYNC